MRLLIVALLSIGLSGCGAGYYKVSPEQYKQEVKTLGVVPLLVDTTSTIRHPQPDAVLAMLQRQSAGRDEYLVDRLRKNKLYFDVRPVKADAVALAGRLLVGSTPTARGREVYRQYSLDAKVLDELARREVVDALLIVVVNGVDRVEKRWDRGHLSYLEAMYNVVLASAMVVTPAGKVLWEYPGAAEPLVRLQYADFDEAYYNKTDEVKIRFIGSEGIERTLSEPERTLFGRSELPRVYREALDRVVDALSPGLKSLFPDQGKVATPQVAK